MVSKQGKVTAVHRSNRHRFSKVPSESITIIEGHGVEGDSHFGTEVQHLSRVRANPSQPNLRQVHLIHSELFEELRVKGFAINPGDLGENVTTHGIDLLGLGRDTELQIGSSVVLRVTGLRNPCAQIDQFMPGLLKELTIKKGDQVLRKAGVMCVVLAGGSASEGDIIQVQHPDGPHIPLERV